MKIILIAMGDIISADISCLWQIAVSVYWIFYCIYREYFINIYIQIMIEYD
jgi:hypothetical protein